MEASISLWKELLELELPSDISWLVVRNVHGHGENHGCVHGVNHDCDRDDGVRGCHLAEKHEELGLPSDISLQDARNVHGYDHDENHGHGLDDLHGCDDGEPRDCVHDDHGGDGSVPLLQNLLLLRQTPRDHDYALRRYRHGR